MPDPSLKVLAKGTAMVPDYAAQQGGVRCFHGWSFDRTIGPKREIRDPLTGAPTGEEARPVGGFVKKLGADNPVEIASGSPFRSDYIRHLRVGDLWPADAATAALAGVSFDPSFGGEHSDDAKAAQQKELEAARALADGAAPKVPTLVQPATPAKKG